MQKAFVTGATGWLGRHLLECLRQRELQLLVLLRPSALQHRQELLAHWSQNTPLQGSLQFVEGDVTQPDLGLSDDVSFDDIQHVFHLAAVYDLAASAAHLHRCNVQGTQHLLHVLKQRGFRGTLHHVSSIAVAGDATGTFREDQLDIGQQHPHPYHASKFASERLVREQREFAYRIYRPSAIVGHSRTGEMERIDGPYYLFKALRKMRDALPRWFPLWSNRRLPLNMLPVDVVAQTIDYLAFREGLDGKTFHVVDPTPPKFLESYNLLADAAGAPRLRGRGLMRFLPLDWTAQLGTVKFFREQILEELDIPKEIHDAINDKVTYDTTELMAALASAPFRLPQQAEYIPKLWDYWLRHLDPDRDPQLARRAAFEGKLILITGASSGVGAALARQSAALGAKVLLAARRQTELNEVATSIREAHGQAEIYPIDLSDHDACDAMLAQINQDHGPIDILVNNAARSIRRPLAESIERFHDFERVMHLNFLTPIRLIRGVLPGMRERKSGHIINVLTAGVVLPSPRFGAYGASKAALSHFTDTLGAELLEEGIYCSGIFLPWVRTPMMDTTGHYKETNAMTPEQAAEWILDAIAHRRPHMLDTETQRRWLINAVAPRTMSRILSTLLRIYPDDESAHAEFSLDRQMLQRWIKGKII